MTPARPRKPPRVLILLALLAASPVAAAAAEKAPLTIASPSDISDLAPVVVVRGTAEPGGSIAWSIVGTDRAGTAPAAADGSFAFSIPTDGLHLTRTVRIVARGAWGAYAERVLLLVDRDPGPLLSLASPVKARRSAPGSPFRGASRILRAGRSRAGSKPCRGRSRRSDAGARSRWTGRARSPR